MLPALQFGSVCVARAHAFSSPPLFSVRQDRRGESSAARKPNKTMESVRHSKANGFTAASSPPSLFMCKSIHRALMAAAMHDTDSFKWPGEKKWESFTHLQSWRKTIQVVLNQHFYLKMVQTFVYCFLMCRVMAQVWFLVDFCRWWLYSVLYPSLSHTDSFPTDNMAGNISWHVNKNCFESQAVLSTPQNQNFNDQAKLYSAFFF